MGGIGRRWTKRRHVIRQPTRLRLRRQLSVRVLLAQDKAAQGKLAVEAARKAREKVAWEQAPEAEASRRSQVDAAARGVSEEQSAAAEAERVEEAEAARVVAV